MVSQEDFHKMISSLLQHKSKISTVTDEHRALHVTRVKPSRRISGSWRRFNGTKSKSQPGFINDIPTLHRNQVTITTQTDQLKTNATSGKEQWLPRGSVRDDAYVMILIHACPHATLPYLKESSPNGLEKIKS